MSNLPAELMQKIKRRIGNQKSKGYLMEDELALYENPSFRAESLLLNRSKPKNPPKEILQYSDKDFIDILRFGVGKGRILDQKK